jgi:polyisoprenoid-binding protein YceI
VPGPVATERVHRTGMNTSTTSSATNTTTTNATRWTMDPAHSTVSFSVRHLMITNVRGEFQKASGEVTYDAARPEATRISATIDVASVSTREPQRDTHLRSAEFFDAEKFPTITFVSKRARAAGDGRVDVTGDLTIRGNTREVTLAVSDITTEHPDLWGNTRIGATASTKIKRSEFGVLYNPILETGGIAIGDEVAITLDVSLVKAK